MIITMKPALMILLNFFCAAICTLSRTHNSYCSNIVMHNAQCTTHCIQYDCSTSAPWWPHRDAAEWRWSPPGLYGFWCIHKISPAAVAPRYLHIMQISKKVLQISEIRYHPISTQSGKGDILYISSVTYLCRRGILCLMFWLWRHPALYICGEIPPSF